MTGNARTLLERERELSTLARLIDDGERPVVAVVEGPAGIGKTALLDSLQHHAQDLSARVLFARGGELERTDAYGIVQQLFGPPLASSELAELSLPARGVLDASEGPLAPPGEDAARAIHHELFGLCVQLAETKRLLIVVDDAHWADERSLRWLLFVARRIDRLPISVVLARRAREPGVDMELLDRMCALDRTEVLTVSPLSRFASASLVRSVLGESADEAFCDACHRATGGNPFLLGALLAELEATGVAPTREAAALALSIGPKAVQRVTLLRLARVSPPAIALSRAIALLDEADVVTAARLADLDERSATEAASALGDAGLLAPGPGLRFAHPLVRSAIYAEIDEHERGRLHRDAAWALSAGDAPAERVAAQLLAAHPAGDPRAVDSLRAAARRTYAHGAPDAAARYLRRALSEPPPDDARSEVLLELGRAEVRSNEPHAIDHLEASVAAAPDEPTAARALRELARAHMLRGNMAEATSAFERAVQRAGADRELHLALEGELAATLANVTNAGDAATRLERYRDLAGETPAERTVLALLAFTSMQQNKPVSDTLALLERALHGEQFVTEQTAGTISLADAMLALIMADEEQAALELLEVASTDARRLGWSTALAAVPFFQAWAHLRLGQLEAARESALAALAVSDERGWQAYTPMAAGVLCETELERGDIDAASGALARISLPDDVPDSALFQLALYARGLLRAARGETEAALADLLLCGEREVSLGGVTPTAMAWRSHSALLLDRLGRPDEAIRLASEEVELARALGTSRPLAIALHAYALIEPWPAGRAALEEAVSVAAAGGRDLEQARALCDLGAAFRRGNRRRDARAPLREAVALASGCGAERLALRAREELLAAGGRPRRTALQGIDSLTPSERRVAELAATGRANREIADELVVTVRTIEFHLSRAYAKLGVASRAELSAAMNVESS